VIVDYLEHIIERQLLTGSMRLQASGPALLGPPFGRPAP
jgi:hypothetical protein